MAPPQFASGPMHVDHIPGRCIIISLEGYEFVCPGCCFDMGKANKEGKFPESRDIALKGLHVENRKVLDRPGINALSTPVPTYNAWGRIPGRSINIRSSPNSGFDVLCPFCAFYLGNDPSVANYNIITQGNHITHALLPAKEEDPKKEDAKKEDASPNTNNKDDETKKENEGETGANGKRTTAVMGNEGVAGINIKGEEIDIEIEAPPANPTTKPTVTLIAPPINADDVVANNHGVAGINIKGTGKVKFVIGKATK